MKFVLNLILIVLMIWVLSVTDSFFIGSIAVLAIIGNIVAFVASD